MILFAKSVQLEGTDTSSTSARATAFLRMMEIPALAVVVKKNHSSAFVRCGLIMKLAYCTLRRCEADGKVVNDLCNPVDKNSLYEVDEFILKVNRGNSVYCLKERRAYRISYQSPSQINTPTHQLSAHKRHSLSFNV